MRSEVVEPGTKGHRQRVPRRRLKRTGDGQPVLVGVMILSSGYILHRLQRELPQCQGTRLVQNNPIHLGQGFQHMAAGNQKTPPPQIGGGGGQRRGHRQRQGTGTGHHQHREGYPESALGLNQHPGAPNQGKHHQHRAHKVAGHGIGQRHLAGFFRFRLYHQALDGGQLGVASDGRHFQLEIALSVQGTADHPIARPLGYRPGLTGQQRFHDIALALNHPPVTGEGLPALDPYPVAE